MTPYKKFALSLSAAMCIAMTLLYWLRPDSCAAVTFFPAWFWVLLGLAVAAFGLRVRQSWLFFVVLVMWAAYAFAFVEETHSILRRPSMSSSELCSRRQIGQALRVVTLNCAGGSSLAASEVKKYDPDIVLLQESPGKSEVARLARDMFAAKGDFVCGPDASIIARGRLKAHHQSRSLSLVCTSALVELSSGKRVDVVSLRLVPPVFCLDLWSPNCWRGQTTNRRDRREQLEIIAQALRQVPTRVPIIIGGDFNAPAGDAIFRVLHPRLHDTFSEGGVGWGNTVLNETPVQRIDQIWVSQQIRATAVRAQRTRNSDHRLVVCDLVWK
ncbi:MAG: endonuclease/exonuclease/phosphatase family protein [Armatimonadota bacterium]